MAKKQTSHTTEGEEIWNDTSRREWPSLDGLSGEKKIRKRKERNARFVLATLTAQPSWSGRRASNGRGCMYIIRVIRASVLAARFASGSVCTLPRPRALCGDGELRGSAAFCALAFARAMCSSPRPGNFVCFSRALSLLFSSSSSSALHSSFVRARPPTVQISHSIWPVAYTTFLAPRFVRCLCPPFAR